MMTSPAFDRHFEPHYGHAIEIAPGVRRLTVRNPGPLTFMGTNSYIVGEGEIAIIDPGPADEAHIAHLLAETRGERICKILITHTHADHSPGASLLKARCNAPVLAFGHHKPARALHLGEINLLDAAADSDLKIDGLLADGDVIDGQGWQLEVLHTPGHTTNHVCFAFNDGSGVFSGDHVMAWSTSIVAPPDGSMASYMDSLDRLMSRSDLIFWPGHGAPVRDPLSFMTALKNHRHKRETAVLERLAAGDETIEQMVATVYRDVDKALHGAAALSMFAQIEYLCDRGLVACPDGTITLKAHYRLA